MISIEEIKRLDQMDPLAKKRNEFLLPNDQVYLDGNSLGALPKNAKQAVEKVVSEEWGTDLIHSWNKHQWINLPVSVGEKIAKLIGAAEGQVVCCDSTSVNLFKVLAAALQRQAKRNVVLSQVDNFPTDLYMAQGLAKLMGEKNCQLKQVEADDLLNELDESVAVLMLTHVNFRSGEAHDMKMLTSAAHQKGVLVIWDLAHSAGALPVELDHCNVDFAVGCGYKYLNGGPGAPAFLYVSKRLQADSVQPLTGWMGHKAPFDFEPDYQPSHHITRFLCGTPSIVSMSALSAALDVFNDVDMISIRKKSIALAELLIQLVSTSASLASLMLISPSDSSSRGSQVAFAHPEAFSISQAMIANKVIVDYREPNILRIGLTPLYTRYQDVYNAFRILEKIIASEEYEQPKFQLRNQVT